MCRGILSDVVQQCRLSGVACCHVYAGGLPRLAWCSIGSNPAAAGVPALPDLPRVHVSELSLGSKLGQGASGEVFNGEQAVAVVAR